MVQLQLCAQNLDNKDTFSKSDPFYVLSKSSPAGQFVVVHRSEVIENNLNPTWKPVNLTLRELCSGDAQRPLKIDIYDWDSDGGHDLIGTLRTNLDQLKAAMADGNKFPVINPKKEAKKKNYKDSGLLGLKYLQVRESTFFSSLNTKQPPVFFLR